MRALVDASAVVDLFLASVNTARFVGYLRSHPLHMHLSEFAAGEFCSAVKRERQARRLSDAHIRDIFDAFDGWRDANTVAVVTEPADLRLAAIFMRRLDINLRMPDAIYVATAQRLDLPLCSFDMKQVAAAKAFGVEVVEVP